MEFEIYSAEDRTSILVEFQFEPASENELLSGEPAYLFNDPAAGEMLRTVLPLPIPGETEIFELTVEDDEDESPAQFRVKIKHTI